jgi:hypothetical protein
MAVAHQTFRKECHMIKSIVLTAILFLSSLCLAFAQPAVDTRPNTSITAPDSVQRITQGSEFKRAAQSKNLTKINQLLKGTGAIAVIPVAIFFCKPPFTPVITNAGGYCVSGSTKIEVTPYMYME